MNPAQWWGRWTARAAQIPGGSPPPDAAMAILLSGPFAAPTISVYGYLSVEHALKLIEDLHAAIKESRELVDARTRAELAAPCVGCPEHGDGGPCILERGHEGPHADRRGQTWRP
jgi:hypothetical protein